MTELQLKILRYVAPGQLLEWFILLALFDNCFLCFTMDS